MSKRVKPNEDNMSYVYQTRQLVDGAIDGAMSCVIFDCMAIPQGLIDFDDVVLLLTGMFSRSSQPKLYNALRVDYTKDFEEVRIWLPYVPLVSSIKKKFKPELIDHIDIHVCVVSPVLTAQENMQFSRLFDKFCNSDFYHSNK